MSSKPSLRPAATTLLEVVGLVCFCVAGFQAGLIAGLVVTGLCLQWLGYSLK